jgi:hypothetical protein
MMEEIEEVIDVSVDDCKRWSEQINENLEDIRAKDGEDTYKLMFMTAFLLQWFAESVNAGGGVHLTMTKPMRKDLN